MDCCKERKKKREREEHKYKKMAMNNYLSIINGFNAPIKRHRIAEWIRNMTHTYAADKRPISGQKTYTD